MLRQIHVMSWKHWMYTCQIFHLCNDFTMIWMAFTGFQHLMIKIQTHDNWYGFHSFSFGIQNHRKAILGYELWIIQAFTQSLRDWLPVKSIWDRLIGDRVLLNCTVAIAMYIYIYIQKCDNIYMVYSLRFCCVFVLSGIGFCTNTSQVKMQIRKLCNFCRYESWLGMRVNQ